MKQEVIKKTKMILNKSNLNKIKKKKSLNLKSKAVQYKISKCFAMHKIKLPNYLMINNY